MANPKKFIITLDGPASTGKSSLAKRLSKKLGYIHIDSGSMYRAATLFALRLDPERTLRPNIFVKYLSEIKIDFKKERMSNEKIILFSPASASFDDFKNFEDRGKYFNYQLRKIGITGKK